MSADVISLRRARKAKARADEKTRAGQNRIAFGRTKAERNHAKATKQLEEKRLDSMMISEPRPGPGANDQTSE